MNIPTPDHSATPTLRSPSCRGGAVTRRHRPRSSCRRSHLAVTYDLDLRAAEDLLQDYWGNVDEGHN